MAEEELITLVDGERETHIYFYSNINKTTTFNLCSSLTGIAEQIREEREKNRKSGYLNPDYDETEDYNEKKIILHINSSGGEIDNGLLIADTIDDLDVQVDTIAEGNVCSSGIILFLAGKNREMRKHASLLFHDTQHATDYISQGNIKYFAKDAKKISDRLKKFYSEKSGQPISKITKLMSSEKRLFEEECLKLGFITQSKRIK